MLDSIYDGSTIPLLQKVVRFGERRQEVLAANIANIDTPNYKRRDLPIEAFQQALREAIATGRSRSDSQGLAQADGPRAPMAPRVPDPFPNRLFQAVEAASPSITFQDNNNRSIEFEMMQMTKNAMMQSYATELMNAQITMLQAAIRGQA
jgi:flagellar basal-body rod protein FlgB